MNTSIIKPRALKRGDTIGLLAPAFAVNEDYIEKCTATLETLGFRTKLAANIYSNATGFSGTITERADDFNSMIADDSVNMLLFGGGEVSNEILPYIDFESICRHPKIIAAHSDSTTVLNAVTSLTGLVTFYSPTPHMFHALSDYNRKSFEARVTAHDLTYVKNSEWRVICPGKCEGILTGGYLINYAAMLGGNYLKIDNSQNHLLFIEDHEMYSSPAMISKWFSHIEQSGLFYCISGLLFGHYSKEKSPLVDDILRHIGERYNIPVVRCEDFGHGDNMATFPIGIGAHLDTDTMEFSFTESGVQ